MDETNFVTVEAPTLIGVGVQSLVEQAKQLGLTWTLQPGTVVSATDTATTVTFDGDTTAVRCANLTDVNLAAGNRVTGIITPTGNYIIGRLGPKSLPTSNLSLESFGTLNLNTTSTSFISIAGAATGLFDKRFTETAIKVSMTSTYYSLSAATGIEFGVLIGISDFVISQLSIANSSLGSHTTVAGTRKVAAALTAGTYLVTPRARATTGGGTIRQDVGDNLTCYLEEVEA
jgi:hypothetical protein